MELWDIGSQTKFMIMYAYHDHSVTWHFIGWSVDSHCLRWCVKFFFWLCCLTLKHSTLFIALSDDYTMASLKQKSVVEEAVQCMICMEYDGFLKCDIKRLPCSHKLCTVCLLNLSSVSSEDHPCTTCRYVVAMMARLFFVCRLVDHFQLFCAAMFKTCLKPWAEVFLFESNAQALGSAAVPSLVSKLKK